MSNKAFYWISYVIQNTAVSGVPPLQLFGETVTGKHPFQWRQDIMKTVEKDNPSECLILNWRVIPEESYNNWKLLKEQRYKL